MESLGAVMMITALAWPIFGGAVVGLIGGLVKGHGLVGTLLSTLLGGVLGYALVMIFMLVSQGMTLPDPVAMVASLGLPILGGLIALGLRGRSARA